MSGGEGLTRRHVLMAAGLLARRLRVRATVDHGLFDLGRGLDRVVLMNSLGQQVTWDDLAGAPRALFFGFTHCPEICPVTIYELTAAAERIGAAAEDLRIHFVTVDPERDTPERMREYFSGFGPNVMGYTGAADMLGRVNSAFEITATHVPLERGGYTMDHTATVFLIDRAARVEDVIAYGADAERDRRATERAR